MNRELTIIICDITCPLESGDIVCEELHTKGDTRQKHGSGELLLEFDARPARS